MVVALTVALSLILTSAQVYRLSADSARIQDIADAAALAAENEVAEFMVAVRVCDAASLSLSLASIAATGVGAAALCIPGGALIGEKLVETGQKIAQARNTFAQNAVSALNGFQKALPFLAAANAASVASKNSRSNSGNCLALAVLVSDKGEDIVAGPESTADELAEWVSGEVEELEERARAAEEAAAGMRAAKEKAFKADCGNNPSYCMFERAQSLAGMGGAENPLFASVDGWSFSVALNRAKAYYACREANEYPANDSTRERARSALRSRYYSYARDQLSRGYVYETDEEFSAYFPLLPRTAAELRSTELFTEKVYPVTGEGDSRRMHAFEGCPLAQGATEWGSAQQLEEDDFEICGECEFSVDALGAVASASSVIANGFEYHYSIVANAAVDYQQAKQEAKPSSGRVRSIFDQVVARLRSVFDSIATCRIEAKPPGSYGAIALAVDLQPSTPSWFRSTLAPELGVLGPCAAVSGATVIEETDGEGATAISSLLSGLSSDSLGVGVTERILSCWSDFLGAYADGQDALESGVDRLLSSIPFGSQSGLGTWASSRLKETIEGLGLQPAKTDALKPVLVNSGLVASGDQTEFSVRFLSVKEAALSTADVAQDLFSFALEETVGDLSGGMASVSGDQVSIEIHPLGEDGPVVPLKFTRPSFIREGGMSLIERAMAALEGLYAQMTGVRIWK